MFKDLPAVEITTETEKMIEKLSKRHQETLIENRNLASLIIEKEGEIASLKTKLGFRKAECIRLADKITEYEKKLMEAYQKIDKLEHDYINEIFKRKSEPIKGVFKVN